VIVWAVNFQARRGGQKPIRLDFGRAKRFDCCEGVYVASGTYEIHRVESPGHTVPADVDGPWPEY
jgi:hypothetical protein